MFQETTLLEQLVNYVIINKIDTETKAREILPIWLARMGSLDSNIIHDSERAYRIGRQLVDYMGSGKWIQDAYLYGYDAPYGFSKMATEEDDETHIYEWVIFRKLCELMEVNPAKVHQKVTITP